MSVLTLFSSARPGGRGRVLGGLVALATSLLLMPAAAVASPSVQWTSPPNNSVFLQGTNVTPTGQASGFQTGGQGLDLALVLDASGSMGPSFGLFGSPPKPRLQWQAEAAIALVNSLPKVNTAAAVIQYATSASIRLPLTSTTSADDIIAAINAVPAGGATATGPGIALAASHLNAAGIPGRDKQMVVISDGLSNQGVNPVTAAGNANAAGIIVHGVVIPGGNPNEMQNIASAGGGSFIDARTDEGLDNLIALFSGFGGTLVGVDNVQVTLPDGTVIANALTDAFGNFSVDWTIQLGDNPFKALATFSDGSTLEADLNLVGVIPLPATVWLMLAGLGAMFGLRRRKLV